MVDVFVRAEEVQPRFPDANGRIVAPLAAEIVLERPARQQWYAPSAAELVDLIRPWPDAYVKKQTVTNGHRVPLAFRVPVVLLHRDPVKTGRGILHVEVAEDHR